MAHPQQDAVDEGVIEAGDDGLVNVYGAPQYELRSFERLCSEPRRTKVTFHAKVHNLTNGGFACMTCGKCSEEPDGTA